jgi:hypothetical protein
MLMLVWFSVGEVYLCYCLNFDILFDVFRYIFYKLGSVRILELRANYKGR